MPRNALTLFSCTTPRTFPEVVLATGPCAELSLALAAMALFQAPPRIVPAPSAAPLTKDLRFNLVVMVSPEAADRAAGLHFTTRVAGGWGFGGWWLDASGLFLCLLAQFALGIGGWGFGWRRDGRGDQIRCLLISRFNQALANSQSRSTVRVEI